MKIFEIIKSRRSVRKFNPKKIGAAKIKKIIDAGRWAPSSCNRQPLKFLVIKKKENVELISSIFIQAYPFSKEADTHILVLVDTRAYNLPYENPFCYLDVGAAIQNILLRAIDLNVASCWINPLINSKNESKLKKFFKIPNYMLIGSLVLLGYSKEKPRIPVRRPIKDILIKEKFRKQSFF